MKFDIDVSKEELLKKEAEIIDWSAKTKAMDEFLKDTMNELVDCCGCDVIILNDKGHSIMGTLTGVHMSYVQINDSIHIPIDDITSLIIK